MKTFKINVELNEHALELVNSIMEKLVEGTDIKIDNKLTESVLSCLIDASLTDTVEGLLDMEKSCNGWIKDQLEFLLNK